jgi:hypothetical protein
MIRSFFYNDEILSARRTGAMVPESAGHEFVLVRTLIGIIRSITGSNPEYSVTAVRWKSEFKDNPRR